MDNLDPYLKRIEILENQLRKKTEELRKERECNKEALRYIFYLVSELGGRVEVNLSALSDQKGELKCRIRKAESVVILRIGAEREEIEEGREGEPCLINLENLIPTRR